MKQIAAGGEITVSYLPDHELIHAFAERQEVFFVCDVGGFCAVRNIHVNSKLPISG